ncbi:hypothetical protein [Lyngbya sp. PCC 8106]|uniref:hypothetical protein n=1 Tax=Lyngbya sp. (strain PCC 8106) TaxID=313612 RepID=UPI0000EAB0DB|nr:hypothetical protein [Lyngbya sp. PCC 8106]EAW39302.1 hypothetical protein L8106_05151 [Lyngbya sp. PCC 8106]
MYSQIYYLLRSRVDGQYVSARPNPDSVQGFLLLFSEDFEALSYLNKHASDVADRFSVESISGSQLKGILQRWGFTGIAMVKDSTGPVMEFMEVS